MIKLAFLTMNKKRIRITIDNRKIRWYDDIWIKGVQMMPLDVIEVRNMMFSGKPNIKEMAKRIRESNTGKDLEEYNNCKTDEELAEFVRRDCKKNGLLEIGGRG